MISRRRAAARPRLVRRRARQFWRRRLALVAEREKDLIADEAQEAFAGRRESWLGWVVPPAESFSRKRRRTKWKNRLGALTFGYYLRHRGEMFLKRAPVEGSSGAAMPAGYFPVDFENQSP